MFKCVEYSEFDGKPELKQMAERATDVLSGVIRSWRDEVQVNWRPSPGHDSALELTLALDLPNVSRTAVGIISRKDFESDEEASLRMDLREVWLDVLDLVIAKISSEVEESL